MLNIMQFKFTKSAAAVVSAAVLMSAQAIAFDADAAKQSVTMKFDGDKGWRANCVATTESGRTVSHLGKGRGNRMKANLVLNDAAHGYCMLSFPTTGRVDVQVLGMDASDCPSGLDARGVCRLSFNDGRARFNFTQAGYNAKTTVGIAR